MIAVSAAAVLVYLALQLPFTQFSFWHSGISKLLVFVPVYLGLLLLQEQKELRKMVGVLDLARWKKEG